MGETKGWFAKRFAKALEAGKNRAYADSIAILEDLAARGFAEGTGPEADSAHPEVYLYLARAWHAEGMFARAATCARSYVDLCPSDGAGWFFLARTFLADGLYGRSISCLKRSLELAPDSVDARSLLGMAYLKARRPSAARAAFEEALTLSPDDERLNHGYRNALFVEAVRLYKRGGAEEARARLTFLINNGVDGVVPRLYLAHALRDLGYLPEALGEYRNAASFAPEDESLLWCQVPMLLALGLADELAETLSVLGAAGDGSVLSQLSPEMVSLQVVKSNLDAGNWAAAAEAARTSIKSFGGTAQAHALMGEAQRNLGNAEWAINHFSKASALDPGNPAPRYGILMVYLGARDWESLLRELSKAERAGVDKETVRYLRALSEANLDGDPAAVLPILQDEVRKRGAVIDLVLALARTYVRLSMPELAIGWYRRVLESDPYSETARVGEIACLEDMEDAEGLSSAYEAYLERWGDNEPMRLDYLKHLEASEDWARAADQAEALISHGYSGVSWGRLALMRRKAKQWRQAAILYRNALRKRPEDKASLYGLVYCLDRMKETKAAWALMREANRAFKADVESTLIEGRLCARAGDLDGALTVFRKAVDAWPKDPRGWREIADIYRKRKVPEMAAQYEQKARDAELALTRKRRPKSGT